jgi:hypothetical protein
MIHSASCECICRLSFNYHAGRLNRIALGVFLNFVIVSYAMAQARFCDVPQSVSEQIHAQVEAQGRIATQESQVLNEQKNLMDSRRWKDGVPAGEQMTTAEAGHCRLSRPISRAKRRL